MIFFAVVLNDMAHTGSIKEMIGKLKLDSEEAPESLTAF